MELKCPQCGKWMAVSEEELLMHDSQVVCPQCLAVCRYEDGDLVVRDDSDAPYRHTANVADSRRDTTKFCHGCGKQLPSGIKFCPYCGVDLTAPFDGPPVIIEQPKPEPQPVEEVKPVEEKKKKHDTEPAPAPRRQSVNHVEDKLRTVSRHYNSNGMKLHQNGSMPSRGFKVIAYAVIAILLALLVYIIIAGASIESAF